MIWLVGLPSIHKHSRVNRMQDMVGRSIGAPTFENFCVKYGKRGKQWEGSWMRVSPEKFEFTSLSGTFCGDSMAILS